MDKITIAIDGYSSCGKSTLAKQLATKLNYAYVDSGAMYRAITLFAIENGLASKESVDADGLIKQLHKIDIDLKFDSKTGGVTTFLNGRNVEEDIRTMQVSEVVSHVSVIKEVRAKLRASQQELGKRGGVVMDGRDIGTAVFPHAELKLFMTASPDVRALRRYNELKEKGKNVSLEDVRNNLISRDNEDTSRKEDPLIQAKDAVVLDNSELTPDEQLALALSWVEERTA
ncbi:MAG: (d)CMP kinase [Flavobacteriales bacterium]|jgi:cytidylate kinase|nr:(d)CMP kinase [Flavobacteriales bacterium]